MAALRWEDGRPVVLSFGRGDDGQLGLGRLTSSFPSPKPVRALKGCRVVALAAGWAHTGALVEGPLRPQRLQSRHSSKTGVDIDEDDDDDDEDDDDNFDDDDDDDDNDDDDDVFDDDDDMNEESEDTDIERDGTKGIDPGRRGITTLGEPERQRRRQQKRQERRRRRQKSAVKKFMNRWFRLRMVAGDIDGLVGQLLGALIQFMITTQLCAVQAGIPKNEVTAVMLPAAGVACFFGSGAFFLQAKALCRAEARQGVTAQPHGISTIIFFAYTLRKRGTIASRGRRACSPRP